MGVTEHDHQVTLFQWAFLMRHAHPELALMFAIPNGGRRDKAVAAKLKAEGVRAGVPDIFLPVPRGAYHGLFIELKRPGNAKAREGKATDEQKAMLASLAGQGYRAVVAVGWDKARDQIIQYLKETKCDSKA